MNKFGQRVLINYKGSLLDGTVFDDNENGEPEEIVLGTKCVMPGLEKALYGMEVGEERTLTIPCIDAYGEYREDAAFKIPTSSFQQGEQLPVGEMIVVINPETKEPQRAVISKIENMVAYLDFNHPLAGKDLIYWIRLVDVR